MNDMLILLAGLLTFAPMSNIMQKAVPAPVLDLSDPRAHVSFKGSRCDSGEVSVTVIPWLRYSSNLWLDDKNLIKKIDTSSELVQNRA